MVAGNTYVFDQSDSSNAGVSLKVAASVRNSGDDELSDADSVYTLEGTPGSAGAKTTVNFAPALATSGSTEYYFYWEVDGSPLSPGNVTLPMRLSTENILQIYYNEEWVSAVTADIDSDDRVVPGRTYTLDLSDSFLME